MKYFYFITAFILSISIGLQAEYQITQDEFNDIRLKVSSLSSAELQLREAELNEEIESLTEEQENTQSPSKRKKQ